MLKTNKIKSSSDCTPMFGVDGRPRPFEPSISVVLPVRNESRFIADTLSQIISQDYPHDRFDIWVIDGMSTDDTVGRVLDFSQQHPDFAVSILRNERMLSSAARNIGIRESTGEFVMFVDGHVHIPSNQFLRVAAELVASENVKVVGRPQHLDPPGISRFQRCIALVRGTAIGHSPESHIFSRETAIVSPISVAIMYERTIFEKYGLFDERFDAAEDYEFNYRLEAGGEACAISPALGVLYYPRDSYFSLAKQMHRYGLGRALFLRKHPMRLTLNTLMPSLFFLAIISLLLGGLVDGRLYLALGASLVVYGIVVAIFCLRTDGARFAYVFRYVAIALTIHVSLGLGFLRGLFR